MSNFNLFSCHKFLEQSGAQLLTRLATADQYNLKAIDDIRSSLVEFSERLEGHANWEEHFVFKLLPLEAISREQNYHNHLKAEIDSIQQELVLLKNSSNQKLHQIYLQFRKFYSELLSHLYDEEVNILKMLQERCSENELRQVDYEIYKSMTAKDIVAMVMELFPPCSFGEKEAIIEDLKAANPRAFIDAWPNMTSLFTEEEIKKLSPM